MLTNQNGQSGRIAEKVNVGIEDAANRHAVQCVDASATAATSSSAADATITSAGPGTHVHVPRWLGERIRRR